jgi:hypothetical protein
LEGGIAENSSKKLVPRLSENPGGTCTGNLVKEEEDVKSGTMSSGESAVLERFVFQEHEFRILATLVVVLVVEMCACVGIQQDSKIDSPYTQFDDLLGVHDL